MKFLILSQFAGSPDHGMVLRNYNWAKTLVDMGHEVTVVASSYSHYRSKQPTLKGRELQEIINGVNYYWLSGFYYDGKSNIKRLLSMAYFCLQSIIKKNKFGVEFDVVIASSPQPFTVFPAVYLAKKFKAKFIFDIRDLWPLTPIYLGGFSKNHTLIRAMQYAEDTACKKADIVTCVPENAKDYLISRGMDGNKFMAIGNGILNSPVKKEKLPDEIQKKIESFKSNFGFIITYIGAMGRANALDSLINAISLVPHDVGCILIGDGPLKEDLKHQIKSAKLDDRILFLDAVPLSQIEGFLSYVDAGYCGLMKSNLFEKGVSPTKLNDYMLAEKPIIFSVGYDHSSIQEANCGFNCEAENPEDIAKYIKKMSLLSLEDRGMMGKRAKEWVQNNNLVSKQMEKLIEKLS